MVQEQTSRLEGTQATDEAIRSRVDELLAGMTAAEKAGQLTQYFYFRLPGLKPGSRYLLVSSHSCYPKTGYSKTGCTFACVPRGLQPNPKSKLRQLLTQARNGANLTQSQVAARLKRPQSFVSKYENGERQLDVIEFIEVCRALDVSPSGLIDELT